MKKSTIQKIDKFLVTPSFPKLPRNERQSYAVHSSHASSTVLFAPRLSSHVSFCIHKQKVRLVFAIILLWVVLGKVEKRFQETVYKWDKGQKKKQRGKLAFGI